MGLSSSGPGQVDVGEFTSAARDIGVAAGGVSDADLARLFVAVDRDGAPRGPRMLPQHARETRRKSHEISIQLYIGV
jgi:hypothetical protein